MPPGPEMGHERVERIRPVVVRAERRLPDSRQQLPKRGQPRQVGAQHNGVDEEPDQRLDARVVAVRREGGDTEVGLTAVAPQEQLVRRHQQHLQRDVAFGSNLRQPAGEPAGNGEDDLVALIAPCRQPASIGGELEQWKTRELPLQYDLRSAVLPGVILRACRAPYSAYAAEGRRVSRGAGAVRPIELLQLAAQRPLRPASDAV